MPQTLVERLNLHRELEHGVFIARTLQHTLRQSECFSEIDAWIGADLAHKTNVSEAI